MTAYGLPFRRAEVLRTVAERLLELAAYTDARLHETSHIDFARHAAMYRRGAVRVEALALRT